MTLKSKQKNETKMIICFSMSIFFMIVFAIYLFSTYSINMVIPINTVIAEDMKLPIWSLIFGVAFCSLLGVYYMYREVTTLW